MTGEISGIENTSLLNKISKKIEKYLSLEEIEKLPNNYQTINSIIKKSLEGYEKVGTNNLYIKVAYFLLKEGKNLNNNEKNQSLII